MSVRMSSIELFTRLRNPCLTIIVFVRNCKVQTVDEIWTLLSPELSILSKIYKVGMLICFLCHVYGLYFKVKFNTKLFVKRFQMFIEINSFLPVNSSTWAWSWSLELITRTLKLNKFKSCRTLMKIVYFPFLLWASSKSIS